jgi:hypothetical protein
VAIGAAVVRRLHLEFGIGHDGNLIYCNGGIGGRIMRVVHVLIVASALARIASADNFTFIIDSAAETATVSDTNISCTSTDDCWGGAIALGCNLPLQPTECALNYAREEYITDPAIGCDPNNPSLPECPNDPTPLFNPVAVIDRAGDIEGVFEFGAISHSVANDNFFFDSLPPIGIDDAQAAQAYIVDNGSGKPQFLDEVHWADGEVDTFDVQFVPDPSSVALVSTVVVLCGILRRRACLRLSLKGWSSHVSALSSGQNPHAILVTTTGRFSSFRSLARIARSPGWPKRSFIHLANAAYSTVCVVVGWRTSTVNRLRGVV